MAKRNHKSKKNKNKNKKHKTQKKQRQIIEYPEYLDFDLQLYDTNDNIYIKVPYPDNYPKTLFWEKNREHEKGLAYLQSNYDKKEDVIYLQRLYVFPSMNSLDESSFATPEERRLVKGLGKRMLCQAIKYLLEKNSITENTTIRLDASGGYCNEDGLKYVMENYSEDEIDDYVNTNFTSVVTDHINYYNSPMSLEDKAKLMCIYFDNQKLVRYYQTYGLTPILKEPGDIDPWGESMIGTIKGVLDKCNS